MEEFTALFSIFLMLIPLALILLMVVYLARINLYIKEIRNILLTKLKD